MQTENLGFLPFIIKIIKTSPVFDFCPYLSWFKPNITESILDYHFNKDRVVKFCSELLKFYALPEIIGNLGEDWGIQYNQHHKPYLTYKNLKCQIQFNISHARDYVVIAIINDSSYEVGIDLEYIDSNLEDLPGMANIVYTDFEKSQIKNPEDFFNLWTKKESLIKASGTGFAEDFYKTTSLTLDDYIINQDYQIYTTKFANEYYLSVCLLKRDSTFNRS